MKLSYGNRIVGMVLLLLAMAVIAPAGQAWAQVGPGCGNVVSADQLVTFMKRYKNISSDFTDPNEALNNMTALINESVKKGWDPRFILGIAGAETTFGRQIKGDYNYWNVTCHDNLPCTKPNPNGNKHSFVIYDSFSAAVIDVATVLTGEKYQKDQTLDEFANSYVGNHDKGWITTVDYVMKQLQWDGISSLRLGPNANGLWHFYQTDGSTWLFDEDVSQNGSYYEFRLTSNWNTSIYSGYPMAAGRLVSSLAFDPARNLFYGSHYRVEDGGYCCEIILSVEDCDHLTITSASGRPDIVGQSLRR